MRRALVAAALVLAPSLASAQRCSRGRAGVPPPIALTVGPADFGTTPVPCSDPRVGLDLRGSLLIDTPDFYGALVGEAVLSGTLPIGRRVWLTGAFTAMQYRYVQNATLLATDLNVGPSDVGVHVGLVARDDLRVSTYLRVLLPTESGSHYAVRSGVEPGVAALWRPTARLSLLAGFSVPVEASFVGSRAHTVAAARASVDAMALLGTWFEPVLGVEVRVGSDPANALEYLAPRASLRFHVGRGVALHVTGMVPLFGAERADARVALGGWVGW